MKKKFLLVASLLLAAFSLSSCESCGRPKTTEEKVEDAAEAVADDIELELRRAGDEIEEAFE